MMDCCEESVESSPDVKKRKVEEEGLLEKTRKTEDSVNICEKVATCVSHILKQVAIKTDLNTIGTKPDLYAEDKHIKVSTVGTSVSDIKKEAERRKLLRLGFVPSQDEKSSVNKRAIEDNFYSSVDQSRKPRARLSLVDKGSKSELVSTSKTLTTSQVQRWGPRVGVRSFVRRTPYLIDQTQVGLGSVFDSHCHLDILYHRYRAEGLDVRGPLSSLDWIAGGLGDKFGGCIASFCDPRVWSRGFNDWKVPDAVGAAVAKEGVYLSIGCHPHFADRMTSGSLDVLDRLVRGDRDILMSVVAVGECGLDYSAKNKVDKELQKKVFHDQVMLALKYNLPLVLHIRDAEDDGYRVLEHAGVPADWIIHRHCFTGDWATASTWLDRFPSSKIGITGCVTFSSATQVHETVRNMPLDRLLLETDAPYFLPVGVDKRELPFSQPGHVLHVAAKVAELKGMALEEVLTVNRRNVTEVYGIKYNK